MHIEIPENLVAALNAKATSEGVSASMYAQQVLERELSIQPEHLTKPMKSAYGLLATHGPGPSAEEIDENRREMFRGFGEDLV